MNLFGGYKGYPRRVEIKTVTGIGWNHYYGDNVVNPNDIALQAGLEFDFNLGKNRNWYITFTPMVQANEILRSTNIEPMAKNADLKANIGVAYQYAELYKKYDEFMSNANVTDTVIVEKIVEKVIEKVIEKPSDCVIGFEKGKSAISQTGMNSIEKFAKLAKDGNYKAKVIGSADSKTGSKEYNEKLALERAKAVANELVKRGIENSAIETTIDVNGANDASRCTIIIAE